jgi:hypothetical protein
MAGDGETKKKIALYNNVTIDAEEEKMMMILKNE